MSRPDAGRPRAASDSLKPRRALVLVALLALSLALRLTLAVAVDRGGTPLIYDEVDYFDRALGVRAVLLALAEHTAPPPEAIDAAYGDGFWPPLHPFLLALALLLGRPEPGAARLLLAVLSALTTPLVAVIAARFVERRAALAAALLHALFPSFVAFSSLLWSETVYLPLVLVAAAATAAAAERGGRPGWARRAVLAGAALGLAALTRTTALAYVVVLPAWLVLRRSDRAGAATAAVLVAVAVAVVAPWQAVVTAREGRLVALATLDGFNLALGNNPWVPAGWGSSWGHEESKAALLRELEARGAAAGSSWRAAATELAVEEVTARPGAWAARCLTRFLLLWSADQFVLRHLASVVYPPLPPAVAGAVAATVVAAHLALVVLVVLGVGALAARGEPGRLLVVMAVVGLLPPMVSIAVSRLALPLVGLLLPAAGLALARLGAGWRPSRLQVVAALAALALAVGATQLTLAHHLQASRCYWQLARAVAWPGWPELRCVDRVQLRVGSDAPPLIAVAVATPGVELGRGERATEWRPLAAGETRVLELSSPPTGPGQLELRFGDHDPRTLAVVDRARWRQWQPTGVPGVEARWLGGGAAPSLPP